MSEGECLLSQIIGRLPRLARGLGEIPAVREEVVEADLEPLGAGGRAERAVVGAFKDSGLIEHGLQRLRGVAIGVFRAVTEVISGRPGWRPIAEQGGEDVDYTDQVVDQLAHRPVRARDRG